MCELKTHVCKNCGAKRPDTWKCAWARENKTYCPPQETTVSKVEDFCGVCIGNLSTPSISKTNVPSIASQNQSGTAVAGQQAANVRHNVPAANPWNLPASQQAPRQTPMFLPSIGNMLARGPVGPSDPGMPPIGGGFGTLGGQGADQRRAPPTGTMGRDGAEQRAYLSGGSLPGQSAYPPLAPRTSAQQYIPLYGATAQAPQPSQTSQLTNWPQLPSRPRSRGPGHAEVPPPPPGIPPMVPLPPRLAQPMQRERISDELRHAFRMSRGGAPVKHPLQEQLESLGYYEPEKWEYWRGCEPGHGVHTTALTKNKLERKQEVEENDECRSRPDPRSYEDLDKFKARQRKIRGAAYKEEEVDAQFRWREANDPALRADVKKLRSDRSAAESRERNKRTRRGTKPPDVNPGGLGGPNFRGGRDDPDPGAGGAPLPSGAPVQAR